MQLLQVILLIFYAISSIFIVYFCLDMRIQYPPSVIKAFDEPLFRCMCYLLVYILSMYLNPLCGLLALIICILIHLDYINLIKHISS